MTDFVGTNGADQFDGDDDANILNGAAGDDALDGFGGDDQIDGGDGDDLLIGGDGDDLLTGGDGDDVLRPGLDKDGGDAGDGFDTLDFRFDAIDRVEIDFGLTQTAFSVFPGESFRQTLARRAAAFSTQRTYSSKLYTRYF